MRIVVSLVLVLVAAGCGKAAPAKPVEPPPPAAIAHPTGSSFTIANPVGGDPIQVEVVRAGNGKLVQKGRYVTMHNVASAQGGQTYYSTREKGQPREFAAGLGGLGIIPGWDMAVLQMREGDLWKVTVPPGLAYGKHGGPKVPPNSTVVLELELLKVE